MVTIFKTAIQYRCPMLKLNFLLRVVANFVKTDSAVPGRDKKMVLIGWREPDFGDSLKRRRRQECPF